MCSIYDYILCVPQLPDSPILSCAPEGVWPHGGSSDALHPVGVLREHVDGLLGGDVMDMHLGVRRPGHQYPVSRVGQELTTDTP